MFTNCLITSSDCIVLACAFGEEANNGDNSKVMVTKINEKDKNCTSISDVAIPQNVVDYWQDIDDSTTFAAIGCLKI